MTPATEATLAIVVGCYVRHTATEYLMAPAVHGTTSDHGEAAP